MRTLLTCGLLLLSTSAFAQNTPLVRVPISEQERAALINMCETARWANRIGFDTACDALRERFKQAEEAAKEPVKKK